MKTFGPGGAVGAAVAAMAVDGIVLAAWAAYFASAVGGKARDPVKYLAGHGDAFALAGILAPLAGVLALAMIAVASNIRFSHQWPLRTNARVFLRWLLIAVASFALLEPISAWLSDGRGTEMIGEAFRSSNERWLFVVAIAVAAPVIEELVVRGTLLPALAATRLGRRWSLVLTSAAWVLAHGNRHPVALAAMFVFGIILGEARLRTGAVSAPIAMHAAWNGAICAMLALG